MTLIPAEIRHPEMVLAPDYGMPSGRRAHKTMKQIALEAEWRAQLPRKIVVEAGRYIALGARIAYLFALVLVGFLVDTIGSGLVKLADAIEKHLDRFALKSPPPPWLRKD